ncbi:hypothetical protein [Celeribacter sp.]|uniref:hypothetical protein n=1 Tax=Celeribacter sp. TaxID=1890673 RepID=UPI003A94F3A6
MKLYRSFGVAKGCGPLPVKEKLRSFLKRHIAKAVIVAVALGTAQMPQIAQAAQARSVITIRNDPGGRLDTRINEINRIRQSGAQVRIVGGYCNSACTMYLGLPNTCVSRNVSFGFHGPMSQFYGMALPPDEFEYWSGVMASYYPGAIRSWYLQDARYVTVGLRSVSGRDLIRLGVRECA